MKLFAVLEVDWEQWELAGVFDSYSKALRFVDRYKGETEARYGLHIYSCHLNQGEIYHEYQHKTTILHLYGEWR